MGAAEEKSRPMTTSAPWDERRKRLAVIGVMIAMFLAALDQTIVAPALSAVGASLGSQDFLSWVISAYLLTSTASTPLYGKVSDIVGRRPTLYAALAIFTFGSVCCALANSMTVLVIARAIQGMGGGGLVVLAQTVVADVASPRERPKYLIYISAVWASSSVAGPMLGGFLAQYFGWPMIFWINVPIGALAFAMCRTALRGLDPPRRNHRLDVVGAILLVAATAAFMLALTLTDGAQGWSAPPVLGLFACAAAFAFALGVHLRRAPEPLFPVALFHNGVFGTASFAIFCSMFAFVGSTVYVPLYLVAARGMGPQEAGAALIVLLAGSVVGANTAGRRMAHTTHYKRIATVGLVAAFCALAALALGLAALPFWGIEVLLLAVGVGVGPLFPTLTVSVQNAADPRDVGVATAGLAFLRSFGGAIGVAVLGAFVVSSGSLIDGKAMGSGPEALDLLNVVFERVFAAEALALLLCLAGFLKMPELPLRGPAPPSVVAKQGA